MDYLVLDIYKFKNYRVRDLLKKPLLKKQLLNNLKYVKRLIINKKYLNFIHVKDIDFYTRWHKELEKDLDLNLNWRRGRKEFEEDMIDFDTIEKIFNKLSKTNKTILELGSYDGYFIKYYSNFSEIILSDINKKSNLYPQDEKFRFYHLNGINLNNIPSSSTDVVFSIDTLVRLERKIIKRYLLDLIRIVRPNGYFILHVPNILHYNSLVMDYSNISPYFYKRILHKQCHFLTFNNQLHQTSSFLICQIKK